MKPWMIGLCALIVAAALCLTLILLTTPSTPDVPTNPSTSAPGITTQPTSPSEPFYGVRIYQCDPKLAEKWEILADRYTAATGVSVTIITVEDECEDALPNYLDDPFAPTIFCLHHGYDVNTYGDYCLDLTGSVIADAVLGQDIFTLPMGDAIAGVAGNVESYGILYNSKLLADAGFTISDITDYQSLMDVVAHITANSKKLGFSAFAAPDLTSTDHGSQLCLLAGMTHSDTSLRDVWDGYIANCSKTGNALLQAKPGDGLKDFTSGKAVFYLGGSWEYENLNKIQDYFLGMIPVYTPENGSQLGLHHSCTAFWCVNAKADPINQALALDFLGWLVTAGEDGLAPADSLEILTPYKDTVYAGNPLEQLVLQSMTNSNNVHWNSCDDLSPEVLSRFGQALLAYYKKPNDETWAAVIAARNGT